MSRSEEMNETVACLKKDLISEIPFLDFYAQNFRLYLYKKSQHVEF